MAGSPAAAAEQSLFIMVGDLSADRHAAKVIQELKQLAPDLRVWGSGGPHMLNAGFERLYDCQDFTLIGIGDSLKQVATIFKLKKDVVQTIVDRKPNAVLLIDFGTFNTTLAGILRKRFPDLPIIYFISPQVWGSRPWRINKIARTVTKMLVIFPFEERIYGKKNVPVRFIGNPQVAEFPAPNMVPNREQFCEKLGLAPAKHIVGVFAGSRKTEISTLLPISLQAMKALVTTRKGDVQFVISQGNPELKELIERIFRTDQSYAQLKDHVYFAASDLNFHLMSNADVVWAKSGTTALETMTFGTPMLVYYRGTWLSFVFFLIFKLVKFVSWPNLLSNTRLVPELFMLDCRADQLVRYTNDLLDVPGLRKELRNKLLALRSQLGRGDYALNCAEEVLTLIGTSTESKEPSQAKV
jgi:lipid-A-disaccharide synthase